MIKLKRLLNKRNAGGYTLVEVIIATALLGILMVGIFGFVAPVFSILKSNDEVKKAERSVATIEHYIAKNLRKSLFIKVFTEADIDDVKSDVVKKNPDFMEMVNFFGTNDAEIEAKRKNYTLRCISIRYETDNNIRNSSTGDTAQKYMLYNEYFNWSTKTLDEAKASPIFEQCFYEDIYPKFEFRYMGVNPKTGDVMNLETYEPSTSETAETIDPLTPAFVADVTIYNNEDITDNMNLLFKGTSVVEANNIKSTAINKGTYKIFAPEDLSTDATYDGENIYIFYVTRNAGVVSGG